MYDAKGLKSAHVHTTAVRVADGQLVAIDAAQSESLAS
jgi:hypothetical protein